LSGALLTEALLSEPDRPAGTIPRVTRPRVAIAHDYLTQRGGAERVVVALLRAFPDATVHTLLYDADATFPELRDARVVTSPVNRVGFLRRHHRAALPVLAPAAGRMTVDADVTIVSSSGWAHGFDVRGRSIVYCHNPARWLYQGDDYLGENPRAVVAGGLKVLGPWLRRWDRAAMARHDSYLVNSSVVRERVRATYGIEPGVLFPPSVVRTDGDQQPVGPFGAGFHLVVSRLLPYKNVDRAIEAFRELPDEQLLVVGHGPEEDRLRGLLPSNVAIASGVSDVQLRWAYAHCAALVAPAIEDFGLTPLEVGAFGKPTLALRGGGYLDTVADGVNGLFFDRPEAADIAAAVRRSRATDWDADTVVRHGDAFSEASFASALAAEVDRLLEVPADR
jgi:glycosyltransferase involved in cell wall biosynthesis